MDFPAGVVCLECTPAPSQQEETATTKKTTNHSKDDIMATIVEKRDEYLDGGGELPLAAWCRVEQIEETYGKCYQSVYNYARMPIEKRTPLGSKPGRPTLEEAEARRAEAEARRIARARMTDAWWFIRDDGPRYRGALANESERRRVQQECNFQRHYQSPTKNARQRQFWRMQLPEICRLIGYRNDSAFLKEEIDLMDRCFDTFGSAEVFYREPRFTDEDEDNAKRRARLERKIQEFQMVQTRHCMATTHSAADIQPTLVAIDYLIGKLDDTLKRRGVPPSGLRWRLREFQYRHRTDADLEVERAAKEAWNAALERTRTEGAVADIAPETHAAGWAITREELRADEEAMRYRTDRFLTNLTK
jgi:hypothetical protein